jgi:hypothetical protein
MDMVFIVAVLFPSPDDGFELSGLLRCCLWHLRVSRVGATPGLRTM